MMLIAMMMMTIMMMMMTILMTIMIMMIKRAHTRIRWGFQVNNDDSGKALLEWNEVAIKLESPVISFSKVILRHLLF